MVSISGVLELTLLENGTFIGSARLRWYGHVVRMSETRFPNFLLDRKLNYGKRMRGRPAKAGWPVYSRMQLTLQMSITSAETQLNS